MVSRLFSDALRGLRARQPKAHRSAQSISGGIPPELRMHRVVAGTWVVVLVLVLARAAGAQRVAAGSVRDSAAVRAVALGIVAADNARDLTMVLGYYAPDAILLPPNAAPIAGADAIRPRYEVLFASYDPAIETVIDEIVVRGDLAYVRGRNGGRLRGRGGRPDRLLNDVYVMILRRGPRGRWLIWRLIWHGADGA